MLKYHHFQNLSIFKEERMNLRKIVPPAAIIVFGICSYAFLLDNKVFEGKFENDPIGWYFLAKGIFCGLSLYLSCLVLETLQNNRK